MNRDRPMTLPRAFAAALLLASSAAATDDVPSGKPTGSSAAERAPASGPGAAVPPFSSVLDGYRPYRADEPLRPWREINDEVRSVGGHAGAVEAEAVPEPDAASDRAAR